MDMAPKILAAASFFAAADMLPGADLEKVGFGGIVMFFVWWTTQRLSKQLDSLADAIQKLHESMAGKPCLLERGDGKTHGGEQ